MTTINSGGAGASVTVYLDPRVHTVLNQLQIDGNSKVSILGDGILQITETVGQHKLTIKNDGLLEVVG
jgi:hypothetical protein